MFSRTILDPPPALLSKALKTCCISINRRTYASLSCLEALNLCTYFASEYILLKNNYVTANYKNSNFFLPLHILLPDSSRSFPYRNQTLSTNTKKKCGSSIFHEFDIQC